MRRLAALGAFAAPGSTTRGKVVVDLADAGHAGGSSARRIAQKNDKP